MPLLSSVVRKAIFAAASLAAVAHAADSSADGHSFTWEAWFTVALIVVLLVAMVLDAVPATSAMVISSMTLYLVGIVSVEELFAGMVNNGVLSIVFLFIIVTPMTQLPLMKRMVEVTLAASSPKKTEAGDGDSEAESREPTALVAATPADDDDDEKEPETVFWPTTKLVLLSILTSSFVENTPHVAAFTPMVTKFCMEHNVAPSLLLLPMNFAVILGNYGVVGCSSNLVFSGLLEEDGYGQMDFFELIKIGGPQLPIICLYLIILPWFLLPRNKGGMVGGGNDKKKSNHLALRLLMSAESTRLVGLTVEKAKRQLAGGQGMAVSKVLRGADEAELDLENDTLAVGDVLFVAGPPALLLAACEHFALDFVTANGNLATAQALQWHTDKKKGHHQEQQTSEQHPAIKDAADGGAKDDDDEGANTTTAVEMKPAGDEKTSDDAAAVVAPAKAVKLTLAEVVLSARNQALGRTVSTQVFQSAYGASILAVRASATGEEVIGEAALRAHVLTAGDTLLLLTATTFERDNHSTYEFLMISMIGNVDAEAEPFVLTFPGWIPFGIPSGDAGDGKPQKKLVVMPPEYGYLSLLIFLAVVVAAVFHVKLSVLCLGGAILIVLSGISTTAKALKMIHLDVYVLIAFSFPLGSAVKNSGLANWIGKQILYAGIKGFPLMLLIVVMAVVLANVITNKAACQVMYPVIIAIYTTRGEDPVPAVMAAAYAVVLALCTPYAIPPNVLVFGPGGYTGLDYLKFGLPLTILCTLMTAVFAMVTYDLEW